MSEIAGTASSTTAQPASEVEVALRNLVEAIDEDRRTWNPRKVAEALEAARKLVQQ